MLVPKLRFKDESGKDYPEWVKKKFENLAVCFDSKRIPVEKNRRRSGDIPYYGANGIQDYINDWIFDGEYVLLAEDGGHYNEFAIKPIAQYVKGKIWVNNHAHIVQANKDNSSCFLFHVLEHKDIRKYINGSTRGKLTQGDMWKILLTVPSLSEQEKIADFLTAYDHMIDVQSQRVEAMKTRKKGLLQQIFSQEIRFKNDQGQNYPEWVSRKLGDSTYIERGGSPRPINKYITEDSSGTNWIKIGDAPVEGNVITSVKEKIIPEGVSKSRKVFKGDLILSNSMSYGRPYLLAVDGCIHDGWLLIRNDKNIFDIRFLMQELSSQYVKTQYDRLSNQGVVSNLNKELVKSVLIKIPSLPEQQKIADFLTAVDAQIEVEEKRLETMKTIKKGLLQQMFI